MKGHLVNCLDLGEVHNFDINRFIGLGPFYPTVDNTDRQIGARLRILWDVIADLKRIQPGDFCFLHSEGKIFGPYILTTGFYESRTLPQILKSINLSPTNWFQNRNEFANIRMQEYGYVASIAKPNGCNDRGINLMELFLRQSMGIFNGIPPRFMYGDTKKIVKPLLHHEVVQLLDMLNFNGDWTVSLGPEYPITGLDTISLDLHAYDGHLLCEKILEAWFMENMSSSGNSYEEIVRLIGDFTYYANSIYTYYTSFLDVLAYNASQEFRLNNCNNCGGVIRDFAMDVRLVELKRDHLSDNLETIGQIQGYMEWAKSVLNPRTEISGFIVAAGFNDGYINFIRTERDTTIKLLQYKLENGSLSLSQVL